MHRAIVSCPHPDRVIRFADGPYSLAARVALAVVAVAHRRLGLSTSTASALGGAIWSGRARFWLAGRSCSRGLAGRLRLVHLDHRVEQRRHRARGDLGPILLGSRNIPREDRGDVGSNRIAPGEGWPEGEALPERPYQGRVAVLLGHDGLRVDVAEMASIGMRTPDRSKRKPICPGGAAGSGGGALGGGTWS
jgi:hypothetical protein